MCLLYQQDTSSVHYIASPSSIPGWYLSVAPASISKLFICEPFSTFLLFVLFLIRCFPHIPRLRTLPALYATHSTFISLKGFPYHTCPASRPVRRARQILSPSSVEDFVMLTGVKIWRCEVLQNIVNKIQKNMLTQF